MEYEIEAEDELFDDSTNPSLKHEEKQAQRNQSSVRPEDYPAAERAGQTAVVIPEEEQRPN
jgi:hypothetical protein